MSSPLPEYMSALQGNCDLPSQIGKNVKKTKVVILVITSTCCVLSSVFSSGFFFSPNPLPSFLFCTLREKLFSFRLFYNY